MDTYTLLHYPNGIKAKLHNRRVAVVEIENSSDVIIELSVFDELNNQPRAAHQVRKGKIVDTGIRLSKEAAEALCHSLYTYLTTHHAKNSTK